MVNLLNAMPIYSRFRNFLSDDPARKDLRLNTFASGLAGLGYRPVGPEQLNDEEARFFYEEVKPLTDELRALGYELPSAEDFTSGGIPMPTDPSSNPNPTVYMETGAP
jgi:hypothetical protein